MAARVGQVHSTRLVEAADKSEAEHRAVDMLRQDATLRGNVLNDKSDPPLIFAEEIEELASFDGIKTRNPGLAFYEDKPAPTG